MSKHTKILKYITKEDLKGDMLFICDIVGLEATIKLIEGMDGITVYFPQVQNINSAILKAISGEMDNSLFNDDAPNTKDIARTFGISEKKAQKIRNQYKKQNNIK